MNDLISRQAAIEAILEDKIDSKSLEIMRVLGDGMQAQTLNDTCDRHAQIIKTLPSAQPDIARDIATILENEQDMRVILQNAQPTQNNDSNALKALDCIERQTGTWIYTPTEPLGYTCSVCGKGCCRFNFCPHCGADMRGEQDG